MSPHPLARLEGPMRAPLLVLLALLCLPVAGAHAVLQSATPAPNGHAEEGLTVIELRFTEDVEREYTNADIIDVQGESRRAGPVIFDPAERNIVRLPVKALESGIYSVSWQTLSVDTHTARGSFVFSVGTATLRYKPAVEAHDHGAHSTADSLRDGSARAAFYSGLFLVLGMPLFLLVVVRDAQLPRRPFATAASFGLVGAIGGLLGVLFLASRTELPLDLTLATDAGRSLLWRALLLAAGALAALAAFLAPAGPRRALAWAAVALAAGSLVATALGSHAAAVKDQRAAMLGADILHLATGAVWIGGVVGFLHVWRGRSATELGAMVARFSPIAIACVATLLATGVYASLRHAPCMAAGGPPACFADGNEPYVALVLLKLALLAPLVALGWYNKYRLGPRLAREGGGARAFGRALAAEALLLAGILVAAGVLASTPPPDSAVDLGEQREEVFSLEQDTEKSHVILQIRPNPPSVGVQQLQVVVHPLGPVLPNSTQVALKVRGPGDPASDATIAPEKVTPNTWAVEDGFFTRPGEWEVTVILQRPDEYARLVFTVPVGVAGGPASQEGSP